MTSCINLKDLNNFKGYYKLHWTKLQLCEECVCGRHSSISAIAYLEEMHVELIGRSNIQL